MTQKDFQILEETILLFWDNAINFNDPTTQQKIGIQLYKDVILIDSLDKMNSVMSGDYAEDQKFLFFIHLDHSTENKGWDSFKVSKILQYYPDLSYFLVSSTPKSKIYSTGNESLDVFTYDSIHIDVDKRFQRQTINMIKGIQCNIIKQSIKKEEFPVVDYAILVALWDDEYEEVLKAFDHIEKIKTGTKSYDILAVKGQPGKRIVATSCTSTGMVDASIFATQMLELFKPKIIFMTGVCGGIPDLPFGSIIVADKIFTFQKGKISDLRTKEKEEVQLYDTLKNPVDLDHLYDQNNDQVRLSLEKFTIEHDDMPTLDPEILDDIRSNKKKILEKINNVLEDFPISHSKIKIEINALACSTMVIDKEGYFEENIKAINRKVVGVEMESYAVARACKFANSGKTKWLVIKSVMDNTTIKEDKYKKLAAFTSAQFLKYLLEDNVM
ncbi:hypothetical protein [Sphingobacterium sp. IITKGP-BTPF85]|uniref:5'-methylthioadenosine/S-adenosylhomocysteine nucleosidase family protein n=1 Tax=Sphingobacterium sp. IITKGP-BTPF85 TaxID=1338009 RepID=UPI000389EEA7|nr:hypothetical protein [Sphingobacterium sp. IITKGP-BTPF85]KKX48148.1 hypothetical protein L950_0222710 [Sphingobacterium sp. IITKGP-BTPF85]